MKFPNHHLTIKIQLKGHKFFVLLLNFNKTFPNKTDLQENIFLKTSNSCQIFTSFSPFSIVFDFLGHYPNHVMWTGQWKNLPSHIFLSINVFDFYVSRIIAINSPCVSTHMSTIQMGVINWLCISFLFYIHFSSRFFVTFFLLS